MKTLRFILMLALITVLVLQGQPTTPFNRGVNLSNWFQESTVQEVHFAKYSYDDLVDMQSLGVDVIRLPINLHGMSSGSPDYIVDPLLLTFLDEIIDWTEELGIHLILDNHSFSSGGGTQPSIHTPLVSIWSQMAEHFLARDSTLYFEIKNEPWDIDDGVWNTIQQHVVNVIRAIDTNRTLIVGPASWNSYNNLDAMPIYSDDNLIYTFHFYDPFIFSHQGASWTDPSMEPLSGVPFPYDPARMPSVPTELIGTWINGAMGSYSGQGTIPYIYSLLDIAVAFSEARDVPIYCGEFGVYNRYSDNNDRVGWYQAVTHYLDSLDIGWTMWDYHGGFGLFERHSYGFFDHDLNIPLVEAMGLNTPAQSDYVISPDTTSFQIYSDYLSGLMETDHSTTGTFRMYDTENRRVGNYSLYWAGASQYDHITFLFSPSRDFTTLLNDDYLLTFWLKAEGQAQDFDVRFIDTQTDVPEDYQWRMGTTLSTSQLSWDGVWQYIQIPLSEMVEKGAYDGTWIPPQGLFDWSALNLIEFVAEGGDLTDRELWFDDIRIVDPVTASTNEKDVKPTRFKLEQNYPNPFNPSTSIQYSLTQTGLVRLTVYDVKGRTVQILVDHTQTTGRHELTWQPEHQTLESGVYIARIETERSSQSIKMLYLK